MSVTFPCRIGMLVAAAVVSGVMPAAARAQISFTQLGALTHPAAICRRIV